MKPISLCTIYTQLTFIKGFQKGSDGLPHSNKVAQYVSYTTELQSA